VTCTIRRRTKPASGSPGGRRSVCTKITKAQTAISPAAAMGTAPAEAKDSKPEIV